ncbi:protein spinster homolog 1-like [Anneissia japonica]|uniref:protein spinster homolog 1-like n=1 Tax=Anneissia japonica TaxID=1529436 RepID=UPI00142572F8|nr:protein spinster homolog 1-like [Anneissia japonica]
MHGRNADSSSSTSPGVGEYIEIMEEAEPFISSPNSVNRNFQRRREEEETKEEHSGQNAVGDVYHDPPPIGITRAYATVVILFGINLLNYMDRYTVAANLIEIQKFFKLDENDVNGKSGLLQTVFIIGYMLTSPIFGYLGDRYSRKIILLCGIAIWSGTTLGGSFVPSDKYGLFLFLRAVVGVGEASYSTVASTIIADLFTGNRRTQMLMLFYFAIPVGSGLGYIAGSALTKLFGFWQAAFRVTPVLGGISCILVICFIKEPRRGQAESNNRNFWNTSYLDDLKALKNNRSWLYSSLGFVSVAWVIGALSLWAPVVIKYAYSIQGLDDSNVDFYFGAVTCVSGFLGVVTGTMGAQWYRRFNPQADPLVCAFGLIVGAPFLYLGLLLAPIVDIAAWGLILIAEILLFLNWALVPDILLSVVVPTRRSTASAIQMLMGHALGDALSPYIIGAISDCIRRNMDMSDEYEQFYSLQYSLYITTFITVLGGGAFLFNALYIEQDKLRIVKIVTGDAGNPADRVTNGALIVPVDGPVEDDQYDSYSD